MVREDGKLINAFGNDILDFNSVDELIREMAPNRYDDFMLKDEIDFKYISENIGNFRVNAYRCMNSLGIVMRVIKNKIPRVEDISSLNILKDFTQLKYGLVLITGPTGSGKSTPLAAMINEINKIQEKHIITLEEPIEYMKKLFSEGVISKAEYEKWIRNGKY